MKTPKEKAKELVDYFEKAIMDADMYGDYSEATKKCALIAVDEILLLYKKEWNIENQYWQEVKNEILKL